MYQIKTVKGVTTIYEGESVKFMGTYSEALRHMFYLRFIALVDNKPTDTRITTLYPVRSLMPPLKAKIIKVYMLEEETA